MVKLRYPDILKHYDLYFCVNYLIICLVNFDYRCEFLICIYVSGTRYFILYQHCSSTFSLSYHMYLGADFYSLLSIRFETIIILLKFQCMCIGCNFIFRVPWFTEIYLTNLACYEFCSIRLRIWQILNLFIWIILMIHYACKFFIFIVWNCAINFK